MQLISYSSVTLKGRVFTGLLVKRTGTGATELWLHYQHGDAVVGWLNVLNAESSVPEELLRGPEIPECGEDAGDYTNATLSPPECRPVWPSGKALGW